MANKVQQERVSKWVTKWKDRLLLDGWGITVQYKAEDQQGERSDTEVTLTAAEVVVDHRYREARIIIYPVFFTRPIGYQRSTIVHEIMHIATDPVKMALDAANRRGVITDKRRDDVLEGVTEYFTKVLFRAYARTNKSLDNYHL